MATKPIPFANLQASGHEELAGAAPQSMNVVTDDAGCVTFRPGISTTTWGAGGIVHAGGLAGLYMATSNRGVFAIGATGAERPIYKVDRGAVTLLGGGISPAGVRGTLRPTFAETELLLVIAGGADIEKVVFGGPGVPAVAARLGGAPPLASHVIANNTRLLANDVQVDRTKVRYSDTALGDTSYAGHEIWSLGGVGTSGYFTAEAKPDDVVGLFENTNTVFVFGRSTVQVYMPDPAFIYAPATTLEVGMSAPYSAIKVDGSFAWLDDKRRFVQSDGRGFSVISDPIQRSLETITTIDDAFGYRVSVGYVDAMCWTFPTDGRTFCLQKGKGWGQWSSWNETVNNWGVVDIGAHALDPVDGTNVIATRSGRLGELSLDVSTDLGARINASVTTGFINRETDARKECRCVRLSLRRGSFGTSPGPQAWLRWRDQPGGWTGEIPIDLGSSGDRETVLSFYSLGTYRRRQWQFEFSGTEALTFVDATEEFNVLGV